MRPWPVPVCSTPLQVGSAPLNRLSRPTHPTPHNGTPDLQPAPGLATLLTAVPGIQSNFAGCTSPQGLLCPTTVPPAGGRSALSLLCSHGFPCKIKITVKGMPGICPVSPLGDGEGWCRLESPSLPGLTLWEPNPREMSIKCVSDGACVGCFTASQQGSRSRGKALPRGVSCMHTEAMSRGGALGSQGHGRWPPRLLRLPGVARGSPVTLRGLTGPGRSNTHRMMASSTSSM